MLQSAVTADPNFDPKQYVINTVLDLKTSGGSYAIFFRATTNSSFSAGTYYSIELQNPTFTGSSCSATLVYSKVQSGSYTSLGVLTVPCRDQMAMRVVSHQTGAAGIFLDGSYMMWLGDSDIAYNLPNSHPAIGAREVPAGNVFIARISGIEVLMRRI